MKKSHPLVGITLEGFQVFKEPTYIPLQGLTLIFGPNSAGKSAVQDALEFCSILREAPADNRLPATDSLYRESSYGNSIRSLFQRHWRRIDGEGDRVDRLSMAVKYKIDSINRFTKTPNDIIEHRWAFQRDTDIVCSFELFSESELLVKHYPVDGGYALRISSACELPLQMNTVDFAEMAALYPVEFIYQDGIFATLGSVSGFQCCGIGSGVEPEVLRYHPREKDQDKRKKL